MRMRATHAPVHVTHQLVHLRRESQSHAPEHVLMRLYLIDKSLVCLQSERRITLCRNCNYKKSLKIPKRLAQWVRSLDLTAHASLSPIRRGFAPSFVNCKKGCTRLAAASDKVYQLLAQGRWFSPGTPASSTTKTGRHDIAEILLKVALKHQKSKSSKNQPKR